MTLSETPAFTKQQHSHNGVDELATLLLADRRSRAIALVGPPAPPRKEEPVLAALELTPTSAFFSSTRSRRVSVPSRHRQRLPGGTLL